MYPPGNTSSQGLSAQLPVQENPEPMDTSVPREKPGLWLADHVREVHAYNMEHCTRLPTLAIDPGLRASLTTPDSWASFKADKRSWKIRTYRFANGKRSSTRGLHNDIFHGKRTRKNHASDHIVLKPKIRKLKPGKHHSGKLHPPKFSNKMETFLCDPCPKQAKGTMIVKLPPTKYVPDGKRIAVVFDRKLTDAELLTDEDKKLKKGPRTKGAASKSKRPEVHLQLTGDRRTELLDSQDYMKPMDVKVLEKHGTCWKPIVKSSREGDTVSPNPLLREYEPLKVVRQNELVTHENDGEYYLNREMLCHLQREKLKRAEKRAALTGKEYKTIPWDYYCSIGTDSLSTLVKQLPKNGGQVNFFFEHFNSAHIIGVFLDVKDNDVHCYLHETEGGDNSVSKVIRTFLKTKLQALYPNKTVTCFYPEAVLQRDFASCGVFALKAMNYFRKQTGEMTKWLEEMKAIHDNPTADVRTSSLTPKAIEEGKAEKDHAFCPIRLDLLPPHLLKMAHIRHDRMPKDALTEKVHKKGGEETLEQYLEAYERTIDRIDYDPSVQVTPKEAATSTQTTTSTASEAKPVAPVKEPQPTTSSAPESKTSKPVNEPKKTVNTASLCKRYLYLKEYQDAKLSETGEQAPIPAIRIKRTRFGKKDGWQISHDHLAPAWLKKARLEDFSPPPSKILKSENRSEINDWLTLQKCEKITKGEWQLLWQIENQIREGATLQTLHIVNEKASDWIAFAVKQPLHDYKWYLINQWISDSISALPESPQQELETVSPPASIEIEPMETDAAIGHTTLICRPVEYDVESDSNSF